MFLDFFYGLRAHNIPVSTRELLDFIDVINKYSSEGEQIDSQRFYQIAKSVFIKDIKYYDAYDQAFSATFSNIIGESNFKDLLSKWLEDAKKTKLSDQRKKDAMNLPSEELIKELQKRIDEQKERHDGGNKWIGTGGTSAFGHSGFNPAGIRVGGAGKNRSALAVAGERKFKEYRTDSVINIRQIKLALKKLRLLKKSGKPKLDIKKTIDKTVANAGEIEIVKSRSRKNNLKLVLLMDVGGSMTSFSQRVSDLFSAANQTNHFKELHHYYFHNIFYDDLYTAPIFNQDYEISLEKIYKRHGRDTKFIIIGDGYMAPYELFQMTSNMKDFYYSFKKDSKKSNRTGLDQVKSIMRQYPDTIWLNPEGKSLWQEPTISAISKTIPMFELTVDGLEKGIKSLLGAGK